MASKLSIKVYNAQNEYIAATHYAEDAAALCALNGPGSSARLGHNKKDSFWIEGTTGNASESYDAVSNALTAHIGKLRAEYQERIAQSQANFERERAAKRAIVKEVLK